MRWVQRLVARALAFASGGTILLGAAPSEGQAVGLSGGVLTGLDVGGGVTAGLAPILPAGGVSAGTAYEVVTEHGQQYLQLRHVTTYETSAASALTGTENGETWANGSRLDAADYDTTTAGGFYWDHGSTSTDWTGGGVTSPHVYRTMVLNDGDYLEHTIRVACNADADWELFGLVLCTDTNPQSNYCLLRVGGVAVAVQRDTSLGGVASAAITVGQRNAGVWLRMVVQGGWIYTYYNTTNQATPPTGGWVQCGTALTSTSSVWWLGQTIRVGIGMITANTANNLTGSVLYRRVRYVPASADRSGYGWGAELYATAAAEQLVGEVDFGAGNDVALNQTLLRQVLADAENTRAGDSATISWSVESGASPGVPSDTFTTASLVVAPAAARYVAVWAKIESATGVEQGSVRLPLQLPVTA